MFSHELKNQLRIQVRRCSSCCYLPVMASFIIMITDEECATLRLVRKTTDLWYCDLVLNCCCAWFAEGNHNSVSPDVQQRGFPVYFPAVTMKWLHKNNDHTFCPSLCSVLLLDGNSENSLSRWRLIRILNNWTSPPPLITSLIKDRNCQSCYCHPQIKFSPLRFEHCIRCMWAHKGLAWSVLSYTRERHPRDQWWQLIWPYKLITLFCIECRGRIWWERESERLHPPLQTAEHSELSEPSQVSFVSLCLCVVCALCTNNKDNNKEFPIINCNIFLLLSLCFPHFFYDPSRSLSSS